VAIRPRAASKQVDFSKYKLPDFFSGVINEKLKKGKGLSNNDQSAIGRAIAQTVLPITFNPVKHTYRRLAEMLVEKYPESLVGSNDKDDREAVVVLKLVFS
jgi:CRISPR/Cas system type I-B associated protein Csh2 (Cas7 group RAMP superfamily)